MDRQVIRNQQTTAQTSLIINQLIYMCIMNVTDKEYQAGRGGHGEVLREREIKLTIDSNFPISNSSSLLCTNWSKIKFTKKVAFQRGKTSHQAIFSVGMNYAN